MSPSTFPLVLAQSLVAIAKQQDDNTKKIAIDKMCALCVTRPDISMFSGVYRTLVDKVIDPTCSELLEKNVLSIALLLNSPKLRPALEP